MDITVSIFASNVESTSLDLRLDSFTVGAS